MERNPAIIDNVARLLDDAAELRPDHPAIVDGDIVSFGDLRSRAGAIASAVIAAGAVPGDRVAVVLPSGGLAAAAYFGVTATGSIAILVHHQLRVRQVAHILDHSVVSLVVTNETGARAFREVLGGRTLCLAGDTARVGAFEPVPRTALDVAQLVYTSGSTGAPKGVVVSHGNLHAGVASVVRYLGIGADDRIASMLPFSFDYGLNQLLTAVATRSTLAMCGHPIARRVVQALKDHQVTVAAGVPPLWLQLLRVGAFRERPLPSLRTMTTSGGRLPVAAVEQLRRAQPQAQLYLMYGLTEAFRSTYLDPAVVDRKPFSIGRACPGAQVVVVDADGRPVGPGEEGELVHRGATVALGYWNDPEPSAVVFRPNPWRPPGTPDVERVVYSGDRVVLDVDGDITFVGREDGLIKTNGFRVSADEVSEALYASGEVLEAVVVGVTDDALGQRIVAHVVFAPDGEVEHLLTAIRRLLPRWMVPSEVHAHQALPRTATGKFDIRAVAAE